MSQGFAQKLPFRLLLAVTLVHVVAWFAYYSRLPAGNYNGPEAQVSLTSALAIAQGTPLADSGRTLYSSLLSLPAHYFDTPARLTTAARFFNLCALLLATGLSALTATRLWRSHRAFWVAGLLVGLNPVLVFWASELSPSLLTTACTSLALYYGRHWLRSPRTRDNLWIGISLSLAALFQSALLPIALFWPVFAFFYSKRQHFKQLLLALVPLVIVALCLLVSDLQLHTAWSWKPTDWGTQIYNALGNAEPNDIKSYSLYRQLHLILWINPIHWGALLVMTSAGVYVRHKEGHGYSSALLTTILLILFALGFTLFDAGSQARSALVPLLAVLAAGVPLLPRIWHFASPRTRRRLILGGLITLLFSYAGTLGLIKPAPKNWEHDYVYLAKANIQSGNNKRAIVWIEKALDLNPENSEMRVLDLLAKFNLWALSNHAHSLPIESARAYLETTQQVASTPTTLAIQGLYLYKLKQVEAAVTLWKSQQEDSALALVCLYWTREVPAFSQETLATYADQPYFELLKNAHSVDRSGIEYTSTEKLLNNMLSFAY